MGLLVRTELRWQTAKSRHHHLMTICCSAKNRRICECVCVCVVCLCICVREPINYHRHPFSPKIPLIRTTYEMNCIRMYIKYDIHISIRCLAISRFHRQYGPIQPTLQSIHPFTAFVCAFPET